MEDYLSQQGISQQLFKVEIDNLKIYGYGIKGYILSMIEAAMRISNNTIPIEIIEKSFNTERTARKTNCFTARR
jgi:putative hydrolase of the HAD superfamily